VPRFSDRQRTDSADPVRAGSELLVFRAGRERFAIAVAHIESVIEMPSLRALPVMPPTMLGVAELRGALLPIYSPSHVLNALLTAPAAALVAERAGGGDRGPRRVGIAIDSAEDVVPYDPSAWGGLGGPLPPGKLVRGVGSWQGCLTTLLDTTQFISACCDSSGESQ
jgi:purine-binding chemotaxis protein CheW